MPTHVVSKTVGGFRVVGYSVAGEETAVALPELNVCFDAGRSPREIVSIDTLCVSHGHMDHAAGVPYYFSQRHFIGTASGRVVVHRRLAQAFQALMACWAEIEGHHSPAEIVGVMGGEEVSLRRNLILRAFDVNHGQYSLGFSVIERRHKLKSEFAECSGPQLVELKKQGVEIENHLEVPLVAYCGDCADGDFLDLDHVRNARLLIVECTFFDPEHIRRARVGRHLHVRDLPEIFPRLRNQHILLTHVTRRTDMRFAKRALESLIEQGDRERVSFLMDRPRRSREAEPSRGGESPGQATRTSEPE
jgi:ribonuclease Z